MKMPWRMGVKTSGNESKPAYQVKAILLKETALKITFIS